jgi:hypothetical protein
MYIIKNVLIIKYKNNTFDTYIYNLSLNFYTQEDLWVLLKL